MKVFLIYPPISPKLEVPMSSGCLGLEASFYEKEIYRLRLLETYPQDQLK